MKNKILFTGFNGKNNSSKLLLDEIDSKDKLYLKNSFSTSVMQLENKLKKKNYELIISFGQAPLNQDTLKIEKIEKDDIEYKTKYDFTILKQKLEKHFKIVISENAGTYLCNNIYFNGLKYIEENKLNTKMIFIHIPMINDISNIQYLSNIFNEYII